MAQFETSLDGNVSEWNEAVFKMMRLHKIQTELNIVKMNPLAKYENGQYNYLMWFNFLCSLYFEGKAKYKAKEIEEIDSIKKVIEDMLLKRPVHIAKINISYGGTKQVDVLRNENWNQIKKLLELLETQVKFYNDTHGLSTSNKESMDGKSILR